MPRRFYWSVAPLGLWIRIGILTFVAAIAHWVHAVLPVWGVQSVFA